MKNTFSRSLSEKNIFFINAKCALMAVKVLPTNLVGISRTQTNADNSYLYASFD